MLLMLLIGWTVLLPALVVAGLYVGSTILGGRRVALRAYEDLFADEPRLDDPRVRMPRSEAPVTALPARSPQIPAPERSVRAAADRAAAAPAPSVSAGH